MVGIYKITNKVNGKVYIGQSRDLKQRWAYHKYQGQKKTLRKKSALYAAMKSYGVENFDFGVLEECQEKDLNDREMYYIKLFDSFQKGYNLTRGGDNGPSLCLDKNPNAVLSLEEVRKIRLMYQNLVPRREAYRIFCQTVKYIKLNTFISIWNGNSYRGFMDYVYSEEIKNIHKHETNRPHCSVVLKDDVMQIRKDKLNGLAYSLAVKKYNHINVNTFKDIWCGKTFKNIQP